jgi:hypothetical protein
LFPLIKREERQRRAEGQRKGREEGQRTGGQEDEERDSKSRY